uniref:Elongator complex protein 2 n=1 Tax=Anser brachyrhynchus TaxID=132585 RepID=A0A8B9C8R3_9AVES
MPVGTRSPGTRPAVSVVQGAEAPGAQRAHPGDQLPAAWCVLPARVLLVLTSQKGIQVSSWFLPAQAVFARGIAAAGERFICVGTSSGTVLVFDIPHKGTNVTVSEVLEEHRDAITDIAAELGQGAGDLVTADDAGTLCIWSSGEEFTLLNKIPVVPNIPGEEVTRALVPSCTCSSVKLWNGVVAAGYGNGQIRLYEAATGVLRAEVNAHARWIYALDLAPLTGKLLSGAEDSFVHVWKLSRNPDTDDVESPACPLLGGDAPTGRRGSKAACWACGCAGCTYFMCRSCWLLFPLQIEHCHAECVTDTQICGARFCDPEGCSFAVTGYDLSEIFRYSQV